MASQLYFRALNQSDAILYIVFRNLEKPKLYFFLPIPFITTALTLDQNFSNVGHDLLGNYEIELVG